ncbi:chemotaxis protein CheB [Massilia sp. Dwa41.01b]|uniref:chemotaxis protein CheB n=1 Tax=unclassified Massilia TaxID=2609279 RepID=UPI001601133A|nr:MULTISPECIES: chemotaxis protein CheB [unclassified Massilia]QNA87752.1 chemotaxis protein CheB [Massilia sp. Dwa41.01b]QNA98658.1 chemotaxis protein CheB [Massilia sp. Se16.2.3]
MDARLNCDRRNIVVIGASAGGVEALRTLFAGLPTDLSASFFVVLHLSPHSPSQLDRILQKTTSMHVAFARDRQPIVPNTVYIAPPDRHLMIEGDQVRVTRGPRECRSRPAVDVLFRSAALAFGPRVIGVILTGSLDDGTAGLWQIKDRKGLVFVQEPDQAAHRSMPDSAIEHVEVDCLGSIERLSAEIAQETTREPELPQVGQPRHAQQVENAVALEGKGMYAGVMNLGKVSQYTCPECHGVLVQIEEGKLVRFRCHTGHAYSFKSLLVEVNEAIDSSLWSTVRAIEERILVLKQLAEIAEEAGRTTDASRLRAKAAEAEEKCAPLRELVLDADFLAVEEAS